MQWNLTDMPYSYSNFENGVIFILFAICARAIVLFIGNYYQYNHVKRRLGTVMTNLMGTGAVKPSVFECEKGKKKKRMVLSIILEGWREMIDQPQNSGKYNLLLKRLNGKITDYFLLPFYPFLMIVLPVFLILWVCLGYAQDFTNYSQFSGWPGKEYYMVLFDGINRGVTPIVDLGLTAAFFSFVAYAGARRYVKKIGLLMTEMEWALMKQEKRG